MTTPPTPTPFEFMTTPPTPTPFEFMTTPPTPTFLFASFSSPPSAVSREVAETRDLRSLSVDSATSSTVDGGGDGSTTTSSSAHITAGVDGPTTSSDGCGGGGGSGLCRYALSAYLVYAAINIIFNLFLIRLLRAGSALMAFISLKAVLPLSIILFYIVPWPLLSHTDVHLTQATWVSSSET
eukprot:GHVS01095363.1.p1 GENE.GHVS01095363.1~~GHVS01095363.1.p1  ORF type:complete len:193 (+),score=64.86 GHVS01095363.1:36-581(+)